MTIKTMLFGLAAAGVGGAALTGGSIGGGPDAEQRVARSPAAVYAAISSITEEGVRERAAEAGAPAMVFAVTKEPGKAVHYLLTIDGKVAGSVDLAVAPEEGGAASRLSAEIELDQAALKTLIDSAGPNDFFAMPDALINAAAGQALAEMARKIEADLPLEPWGPEDLAGWNSHGGHSHEEGGEMHAGAEAAPGPLGSTEPMVDPNAEAEKYLKGGQQE